MSPPTGKQLMLGEHFAYFDVAEENFEFMVEQVNASRPADRAYPRTISPRTNSTGAMIVDMWRVVLSGDAAEALELEKSI